MQVLELACLKHVFEEESCIREGLYPFQRHQLTTATHGWLNAKGAAVLWSSLTARSKIYLDTLSCSNDVLTPLHAVDAVDEVATPKYLGQGYLVSPLQFGRVAID